MRLAAPVRRRMLSGTTLLKAEDPRRDEQMAAMHIWPATGRRVKATPRKRPAAVVAARAAIHEEIAHGQHES